MSTTTEKKQNLKNAVFSLVHNYELHQIIEELANAASNKQTALVMSDDDRLAWSDAETVLRKIADSKGIIRAKR